MLEKWQGNTECLKYRGISFEIRSEKVSLKTIVIYRLLVSYLFLFEAYTGMSQPAVRRLRLAIAEKRKKPKKLKGLFGTLGKKESHEVTKVLLPAGGSAIASSDKQDQFATSLIGKDEVRCVFFPML